MKRRSAKLHRTIHNLELALECTGESGKKIIREAIDYHKKKLKEKEVADEKDIITD